MTRKQERWEETNKIKQKTKIKRKSSQPQTKPQIHDRIKQLLDANTKLYQLKTTTYSKIRYFWNRVSKKKCPAHKGENFSISAGNRQSNHMYNYPCIAINSFHKFMLLILKSTDSINQEDNIQILAAFWELSHFHLAKDRFEKCFFFSSEM